MFFLWFQVLGKVQIPTVTESFWQKWLCSRKQDALWSSFLSVFPNLVSSSHYGSVNASSNTACTSPEKDKSGCKEKVQTDKGTNLITFESFSVPSGPCWRPYLLGRLCTQLQQSKVQQSSLQKFQRETLSLACSGPNIKWLTTIERGKYYRLKWTQEDKDFRGIITLHSNFLSRWNT